ncbi:MAG TPA: hypothetical protein QF901_15655, partial [Gammaproteobacteria bacterium]|nr:hypothetical protein [Gammaproteobacteria bacterium]
VTAMLLVLLAMSTLLLSILIAVKPAADHANESLTKKANTVGLVENIVVGVVALTGVVMVFSGSWSFSQLWLWMSVLIVVSYSAAMLLITAPARSVIAEGSNAVKVGMQVTLHIGHLLLLIVAFAFMVLKPI